MEAREDSFELPVSEGKSADVVYNYDKDFYKGMGGELRLKAEGLFKKAKEKGISIEDIHITTLKENHVEFPGIGAIELPTYIVKVRGRHVKSGQVIVDGKQIDYYNRYHKYASDKIEGKNLVKDERGKVVRENGRPKVKKEIELVLTDWERFEIGKSLVDDKEFGLEKTITGACDRVIRKLMGENDWLYPEEARLLDEEFTNVQQKIVQGQETKKQTLPSQTMGKKATERQIGYLKAKLKNLGLDAENDSVMREVLRQAGFQTTEVNELSTGEMSKLIDNISSVAAKTKEAVAKQNFVPLVNKGEYSPGNDNIKQ